MFKEVLSELSRSSRVFEFIAFLFVGFARQKCVSSFFEQK